MKYAAGEKILYALTAAGNQSFNQLTRVLSRVRLSNEDYESINLDRWIIANNLSGLGHCEWVNDGETQRLFVTRSVLARLPVTGLPAAVLVGSRQPETPSDLRRACAEGSGYAEVFEEVFEDENILSPNRLMVQGESLEVIENVADRLGIPFLSIPPAWTLSTVSPKLDSIITSLEWMERPIMDWKQTYFDPFELRSTSDRPPEEQLSLIRYLHPFTQQPHFELRRGKQAAFCEGEWARYAVLNACALRILRYDSLRHQFCVPTAARLPRILARALCFCSGRPPSQLVIKNRRFEIFHSVPSKIAAIVGDCLNQEIRSQVTPL